MVFETRSAVVSLAVITLLLSSVYAIWIRDRVPTKMEQLRAMTVSDYLVLFGHIISWIFVFGCGIGTIFGLTDIRACTFAGSFCVIAVACSKVSSILLVNEKMRQISTSSQIRSRTEDMGFVIHTIVFMFVVIGLASWLFSTFNPDVSTNKCKFQWGVSAFFCVLLYIVACELYLTIRCSWTLIRTKHDVMRSWAYRLIFGCFICVAATLSNLIYLAVLKARMEAFGCLRSCMLDVFLTSFAMHYVLQPKPLYKAMDELPVSSAVDFVKGPSVHDSGAPSIFSRLAPSYRTRATADGKNFGCRSLSIKDKGSRVSVALVSGATPGGISAYLSQVSEEFPVVTSPKHKPRHVSLLPSHPSFSTFERPRPNFSHYPNYSLEDMRSLEEGPETMDLSPHLRGAPGTEIVMTEVLPAECGDMRVRADLFSCESDKDSDDDETAIGHSETSASASTDTRPSAMDKRGFSVIRFTDTNNL